jgi:hypothetical protein
LLNDDQNEFIQDWFERINASHFAEVSGPARWQLSLGVRNPGNGVKNVNSIDSDFRSSRQQHSSDNQTDGRFHAGP